MVTPSFPITCDLPAWVHHQSSCPKVIGLIQYVISLSNFIDLGANSTTAAILRQKLPEDMFISPSDLNVSIVIGQGNVNCIHT